MYILNVEYFSGRKFGGSSYGLFLDAVSTFS
jgi:hypothetical protein